MIEICKLEFYIFIDKNRLYTCGDDDDTDESPHTNRQTPLKEANVPDKVKSVACGHHHNIVLTGRCSPFFSEGNSTIFLRKV